MKRTRRQIRQAGNIDLTKEPRECLIRVAPQCAEGAVLCHWRQSGISGGGHKVPDLLAAWGCSACHELVDHADRDNYELRLDFAKAVFRTQAILISEGKVSW